ncbi:MAG: DNA recombination protein RmuC [Neisseriaceae bacterium]|jgi:DNA recombination protein RmuC|nr:MAG: DNA recombination protein RmuC [Neisseriaceae bacterium]
MDLFNLIQLGLSIIIIFILVMIYLKSNSSSDDSNVLREIANLEKRLRDEFTSSRNEASNQNQQLRKELSDNLASLFKDFAAQKTWFVEQFNKEHNIIEMQFNANKDKINDLIEKNRELIDKLINKIDGRLKESSTQVENSIKTLQEKNERKLEEMRITVDEKLQGTLEKRLGESFKLVSDRLEQVHKGLGEMQTLASGVGDLKKVLTNVKSRGVWGEMQLENLLEQVMNQEQYVKNIVVKNGSRELVEFAIVLPGQGLADKIYLPIDAKFPIEDYQRLLEAQEIGDLISIESSTKDLERRILDEAKKINEKYINPPTTTDFAIMYLPTEGLFAEVMKRAGLIDKVRNLKVVITGPTTLWSVLNSLQMGFKTLAIQKRSSEVWEVLGAVKTEWAKYGDALEKVKKKLSEASNVVDATQTRVNVIGRKLNNVEALPEHEANTQLGLNEILNNDDE